MNISAINNGYNVATKSTQYDTTYPPVSIPQDDFYMEEEPKSTSSMLPLVAMGLVALGGIGYGIYAHKNVSSLEKTIAKNKKELEEAATKLKDEEAKHLTTKNALDSANAELEKLKNPAKDKTKKPNIFKCMCNSIKNWVNSHRNTVL